MDRKNINKEKNMVYSTEFKINREKGVVVCIVKTREDVAEICRKYNCFNLLDYISYYEERVYKGIARCAPEDEWDETYGKRLAEYRAMTKRANYVNRKVKKIWKDTTRKLNNLYKYGFLKDPKEPEMVVNADV